MHTCFGNNYSNPKVSSACVLVVKMVCCSVYVGEDTCAFCGTVCSHVHMGPGFLSVSSNHNSMGNAHHIFATPCSEIRIFYISVISNVCTVQQYWSASFMYICTVHHYWSATSSTSV